MELEPFLHHFWTFSFFELFEQKIRFLGEKTKKKSQKNNQSRGNLMINSEKKCHQPQNAPIISSIISIFLADNQV